LSFPKDIPRGIPPFQKDDKFFSLTINQITLPLFRQISTAKSSLKRIKIFPETILYLIMIVLFVVAVVVGLVGNYEMVIHQTHYHFFKNSLPSNLVKN
jgi:hypothetical protein